jgi:hypothetical protein
MSTPLPEDQCRRRAGHFEPFASPGPRRAGQRTALRKLALELSVEARMRVLVVEKLLGALDQLPQGKRQSRPWKVKRKSEE